MPAKSFSQSDEASTPDPSSNGTRTENVYSALRAEILAGALMPSARLRLVELAERFAVSQTVIREALTRLAAQKIVTSTPQQGFRVAALTISDLTELTEARSYIEGTVLALAIQRGDIQWEASVVASHHQLLRTPVRLASGGTNPEWMAVHEVFHAKLFEGCANERLRHVALTLRDAAALYRAWSGSIGQGRDRDLASEHHGLLEAVLARDPDLAVERLRQHIEHTSAALLAVAERA